MIKLEKYNRSLLANNMVNNMSMPNVIVRKNCLAGKIKDAINNKQNLTLSYEELIDIQLLPNKVS